MIVFFSGENISVSFRMSNSGLLKQCLCTFSCLHIFYNIKQQGMKLKYSFVWKDSILNCMFPVFFYVIHQEGKSELKRSKL